MTDEAMIEAMAQVVLRSPRDFHADYKVWPGPAQSKHIAETVFAASLTELKQEIRREVDNDLDGFIFDWFNERDPDGMAECLKAHADRALSEPPVPTEETK